MATIAIGDIHGNLAALQDLLGQLQHEADRGDAVVFLGDYIDRGPERPNRLMWGHARFPAEYRGEDIVVYGRWNDANINAAGWPLPRMTSNTVEIDTISHGVLTAFRLPDRQVFQSARHLAAESA